MRDKPKHGDRWGNWRLNLKPANNPSLDYVGEYYEHNPYEIPLSELRTLQDFNHWVRHLCGKIWGRENIDDFIQAREDIVRPRRIFKA